MADNNNQIQSDTTNQLDVVKSGEDTSGLLDFVANFMADLDEKKAEMDIKKVVGENADNTFSKREISTFVDMKFLIDNKCSRKLNRKFIRDLLEE